MPEAPFSRGIAASTWLAALDQADVAVRRSMAAAYGTNPTVLDGRRALLARVVRAHVERFGDGPIRVFRAPGRVNLRGMHVDTHGGYLNLMTHQREVVVVAGRPPEGPHRFVNIDPAHPEAVIDLELEAGRLGDAPWHEAIVQPDVLRAVQLRQGDWTNYLRGALLRAERAADGPVPRMAATVGSDLPAGAALSSSHALCTAVLTASLGLAGHPLDPLATILAVRDAEWYTGARSGLSDQAAMALGGRGDLVNVALFQDAIIDGPHRLRFPDELALLVVNSYTARSLSGAQLVEYTRNRFAYSLALTIARQELAELGVPAWRAAAVDRLSALSPAALAEFGGERLLYRMLRRVPEEATLAEIRARYAPPGLAGDYERYFGTVPEDKRPTRIRLRGPLIYGIAESERACRFADALRDGAWQAAGQLMFMGHDGDRRVCSHGRAFVTEIDDAALRRLESEGAPIALCPGVYGASTPVLDALVDAARGAGALGACLTGAGLAGSVLALCRADEAGRIAAALRATLATDAFRALAGWDAPLTGPRLDDAVVQNASVAAAGELAL